LIVDRYSRIKCLDHLSCSEFLHEILTEPENRIAILTTPKYISLHYKVFYRSGVPSVFVAEEDVAITWFGFVMDPPMKDIITLKASQLQQAGIMQRSLKPEFKEDFELEPEEIGPQVLTLQHLEAGFVVILFLLLLSIVVFAVEFASKLLVWIKRVVFCCVRFGGLEGSWKGIRI
jgi:hypothetical protein